MAENLIWVVDGSNGIYIPQIFCEEFEDNMGDIDHAIIADCLDGPDHEFYWDSWMDIETTAIITDDDGVEWDIYTSESGDVFLHRVGTPYSEDEEVE